MAESKAEIRAESDMTAEARASEVLAAETRRAEALADKTLAATEAAAKTASANPAAIKAIAKTADDASTALDAGIAARALAAVGHRQINQTWETTQAVIAILVTLATLIACVFVIMYGEPNMAMAGFQLLASIVFLVVGTYFQRTNHTKSSGGVHEYR